MHGGAPGALVGALVTGAVGESEQMARVQIDLERPVPLEPLLGRVRRRQVSRRVAHLELELSTSAGRAVSARALLTHREPISITADAWSPPPGPQGLAAMDWSHLYPEDAGPNFVRDAVEHRIVRGGYGVPVSSAAWLRLTVPVVDGRASCGLSQLLGVGDFGSPLSQTNAIGSGSALINLDLNATLFRQPTGPWFFLDATGQVGQGGLGLAVTQVFDLEGPLGVITQSQVVHRLAPRS
jgi:Thioesterase-like superfamily